MRNALREEISGSSDREAVLITLNRPIVYAQPVAFDRGEISPAGLLVGLELLLYSWVKTICSLRCKCLTAGCPWHLKRECPKSFFLKLLAFYVDCNAKFLVWITNVPSYLALSLFTYSVNIYCVLSRRGIWIWETVTCPPRTQSCGKSGVSHLCSGVSESAFTCAA